MTREEQKRYKEVGRAFDAAVKNLSKEYGYQKAIGIPYKIDGDYMYEAHISTHLAEEDKVYFYVEVYFKYLPLDELFWEIFGMKEEAKKQPKSFHLKGAFTTHIVSLGWWESEQIANIEELYKATLKRTDALISAQYERINSVPKIAEFMKNKNVIYGDGTTLFDLELVLIDIFEKRYDAALEWLNKEIAKGEKGTFSHGEKGIYEFAKDYCLGKV